MTRPLATLVLLLAACSGAAEVGASGAALSHPAFDSMPPESQQAVRRATVGVLLLPERYAPQTIATSGDEWMALSARDGELTLSLHATTRVHHELADVVPDGQVPAPRFEVRGLAARSGANEGIRYVTWVHSGTAYSLELECFHVLDDTRCAEPEYALDLADELIEWQP